ncbi:MAG: Holliday junction branch migration protein RuvA [Candidatus Goldbacteria bacterium]|nr:Holliday junction branch migration protein RuvA [Candidatus Goldiibacteriota bacterium]
MIDFLEGIIEEINEKYLLLNVSGVGYGINISSSTFEALKDKDGIVRIFTYLSVTENNVSVYGFSTPEEKEIFLALLNVEGIGPKGSINILSGTSVDKLKKAIASGDEFFLTSIPGLGPKKAKRIIVELKDKFKIMDTDVFEEQDEDYLQVLLTLGFQYNKAREALKQTYKTVKDRKNKEEVIKEALKFLSK